MINMNTDTHERTQHDKPFWLLIHNDKTKEDEQLFFNTKLELDNYTIDNNIFGVYFCNGNRNYKLYRGAKVIE